MNDKNPVMTFEEVEREHEELTEMFLVHQEALLALDPELAAARLDRYEQRLLRHMDFEEQHLIPIYARAGNIPGGPVEFYTGEHARMREFLGRFRAALADLRRVDPARGSVGRAVAARKVIALFDAEATYKNLAEHHHMREGNLFFPTLERLATSEEKVRLLERFRGERQS